MAPSWAAGLESTAKGSPIFAQVLSLAMMLRYSFNMHTEADAVEKAVERVLDSAEDGGRGIRTRDLGGQATTAEMSAAILEEVRALLNLKS